MAWKGGAIVTTSEVEIVSSTVIEVKFTSEAITPEQGAQRQREARSRLERRRRCAVPTATCGRGLFALSH